MRKQNFIHSMEDECEKIEQEIRKKHGGSIKAAYGCSLGGSFVSLLIQRKRIHIEHGIIGSSDMDEAGNLVAKNSGIYGSAFHV